MIRSRKVYIVRKHNIIMDILESLTEEDIDYNLRTRGYPLFGTESIDGTLISPEELIITLLQKKDARQIEGVPVIISKNPIDYNKLIYLAVQHNIVNPVGWILDETYQALLRMGLVNNSLKYAIDQLFIQKNNLEYVLSSSTVPEYLEFSRQTRSSTARKWNVVARYSQEGFDKKLRTYRKLNVS